jgi:hypothetical protein
MMMIYYEDFLSLIRLIDTRAPTFAIKMANIECLICTAHQLTDLQRYDLRTLVMEKRTSRGFADIEGRAPPTTPAVAGEPAPVVA